MGPGTNIGYGLKEIVEMTDEVGEAREVLHLREKTRDHCQETLAPQIG
jgi:hypothetical protein